MADGITIDFDNKDVERLLNKYLRNLRNSSALITRMGRYVHAMTMKMFRGRRPDTVGVRGQKWPKLAKSTLKSKLAAQKRGAAITSKRPLVYSGELRDSLKVLRKTKNGFEYGTNVKSRKGFPYPGIHQTGGKNLPQRKFLFLTRKDLQQMVKMTIDHIRGIKL